MKREQMPLLARAAAIVIVGPTAVGVPVRTGPATDTDHEIQVNQQRSPSDG